MFTGGGLGGKIDLHTFDGIGTSHVFYRLVIGMAQTTVPGSDIRYSLGNKSVVFDKTGHGRQGIKAMGAKRSGCDASAARFC